MFVDWSGGRDGVRCFRVFTEQESLGDFLEVVIPAGRCFNRDGSGVLEVEGVLEVIEPGVRAVIHGVASRARSDYEATLEDMRTPI